MPELKTAMNAIEINGEMVENNDVGSSITVTTAGTYYGWTTASDGNSEKLVFSSDATADRLTVLVGGAGTYSADGTFSFSGTGNATIQGAIHVDGVINDNCKFRRKIGVGGDTGNASLPRTNIVLAEGQYVDMRFTSDGNGDDLTIYNGNINLRRIKR